jgi:hypothetical protein
MFHSTNPALAGGNEVVSLLQLLCNQPPGPLRDHLIQEATKKLLGLEAPPPVVDARVNPLSSEAEVDQAIAGLPPLIRLPKPGQRCPYTGLSRTGMTELISPGKRNNNQPPVSAIHRRSHARAKRGIWQIPTRNLFRHLLDQRKNTAQSYAEMKEARKAG